MTKTFVNNCILILMSLFFLANCTTSPTNHSLRPDEILAKIKLGDSEDKVVTLWVGKVEESSEQYGSKIVKILNYSGSDGRPEAFFSIDSSTKQVMGKALWVYSRLNLEDDIKAQFKNIQWQAYTPCHTRSDKDKILVNRDQGIALDIGGNGIGLISWSTPELLSLRIELIMKTCPRLQRSQKN